MKYGTKDLMNLHDDMSRFRERFLQLLTEAMDTVNDHGMLGTDAEHEKVTQSIISTAAKLSGALSALAVLHTLVRVHKPMVASFAAGNDGVPVADVTEAMKRDLVHLTIAGADVRPDGKPFWDAMATVLASTINTFIGIERHDAACRAQCESHGLDYDKLMAGDPDELARAKEHGIEQHTYGELLEAMRDGPEVKVMTVEDLMRMAREGAVDTRPPSERVTP